LIPFPSSSLEYLKGVIRIWGRILLKVWTAMEDSSFDKNVKGFLIGSFEYDIIYSGLIAFPQEVLLARISVFQNELKSELTTLKN